MANTKTHPVLDSRGIQGLVNNGVLNPHSVLNIGIAAGVLAQTHNPHDRDKIIVGKDTRLSGYMLEPGLISGLTAAGVDVMLTGPVPIPAISLLVPSMRAELGIMISAGDRPYEENGIMLFDKTGARLSKKRRDALESLLKGDLSNRLAASARLGRAKRDDGAQDRYLERVKEAGVPKNIQFDGLRVALDCAHGAAYKVAPAALRELGAEVFPINIAPDGFNINQNCGVKEPQALVHEVWRVRADLGIALDGGGEGVVLVDEYMQTIDQKKLPGEMSTTETGVRDGLLLALRFLSIMAMKKVSASQVILP